MKRAMALCSFVIFAAMMMAGTVSAQDKASRPSPPASADCTLPGGGTIHVDYSVPSMKGRVIFGKLVPYGEVWRAGANEATTFVTDVDLSVGGKAVPAGSYTIFAVPEEAKWTLIISKATGEWGTDYPGADKDLARVEMKVARTAAPVEDFTIAFAKSGDGCVMNVEWENTRASVGIAERK